MMKKPPTRQALQLVNQQRRRKKAYLYKVALGVLIDKTTAIYLLIIGGYIFVSFFIMNDFIMSHYDIFVQIEEQARKNFWLMVTVIPLRYMMQSFSKPGVFISTSEYRLSLLPFDRSQIWVITALRGLMKKAIIYLAVGLIVAMLVPISVELILLYVGLFMVVDALMTIPQWKLFQVHFFIKVVFIFFGLFLNALNLFFIYLLNSNLIGVALIVSLVFLSMLYFRSVFTNVNWTSVTEANDFAIWNMWIVARASGIKYKKQKKYNLLQKLPFWRKPLRYNERALHRRLWQIYFGKNLDVIFQLFSVLLVMMIVLQFINKTVFFIGIVVMLHIYTTVLTSLFHSHFTSELVQVLPWNLSTFKRTFFPWAFSGIFILFLPTTVYLFWLSGLWMFFQLLFYVWTFIYLFRVKIGKSIVLLSKQKLVTYVEEGFGVICLIGVWYSGFQPAISLLFIVLIPLMLHYRPLFSDIRDIR